MERYADLVIIDEYYKSRNLNLNQVEPRNTR